MFAHVCDGRCAWPVCEAGKRAAGRGLIDHRLAWCGGAGHLWFLGDFVDRGGTFLKDWELNGGVAADLAGLTDRHVAWLVGLPHMVHLDGRLFVHADALFYYRYGQTAAEVNAAIGRVLRSDETAACDRLLGDFSERNAFLDGGAEAARRFLATYGGSQIVHGHTPLHRMSGQPAGEMRGPYVYAEGLCINMDGGMNSGGPGFVGWLEAM